MYVANIYKWGSFTMLYKCFAQTFLAIPACKSIADAKPFIVSLHYIPGNLQIWIHTSGLHLFHNTFENNFDQNDEI